MKQTPQTALKDYNLIEVACLTSLTRSNTNYYKEGLQDIVYDALSRLEQNQFAHHYKGRNLYEMALEKLCQKEQCIEYLFRGILSLSGELGYDRFKLLLKFMPKKLHQFEHVLMAVSNQKINYLNDFVEAGYDIYQANGSIVIPLWCQLLKEPQKFEYVVNQFRLKTKNWANDLIEGAISFGNSDSLIYLSEKNLYNPTVVHHYLDEWHRKDATLMATIESLDILFEKRQLENKIGEQISGISNRKMKI